MTILDCGTLNHADVTLFPLESIQDDNGLTLTFGQLHFSMSSYERRMHFTDVYCLDR